MTVQTRMRDLLLPIPSFSHSDAGQHGSRKSAGGILAGAPPMDVQAWWVLLRLR
jgi:hypothetical protein